MALATHSRVWPVLMDEDDPIVAVGLLTQNDLNLLGSGFRRAFRLDAKPCFEELLAAIDEAEKDRREVAIPME